MNLVEATIKALTEQKTMESSTLHNKQDVKSISVKALFDKYGTKLSNNNEILVKDGYYDLIDENGILVCADGEECYIQDISNNTVTLLNFSGETDATFKLNLDEFKVATDINNY